MFEHIARLFRNSRVKAEQRDELEYRINLADLRRRTKLLQQTAERASKTAYDLEVSGKHAEAVAKATEAVNARKAYEIAQRTMVSCESTHAQAKTQQTFTELMNGCERISKDVLKQVDMDAAIKSQARMTRMATVIDEVQESMVTFQESFITGGDPSSHAIVGEEALAEIMAANTPDYRVSETLAQETLPGSEEAQNVRAQVEEAVEEMDGQAAMEHMEWLNQKRRELAEIT